MVRALNRLNEGEAARGEGPSEIYRAIGDCPPTPEQLADRLGRDDGIPSLTVEEWEARSTQWAKNWAKTVGKNLAWEGWQPRRHTPGIEAISRPVLVTNRGSETRYQSCRDAADDLGIPATTVRRIALGKRTRKKYHGLTIEFISKR